MKRSIICIPASARAREIPCEGSAQGASFAVGTPWPERRFGVRGDEVRIA